MDLERDDDNATPQATPPTWPMTFDPTPPNAAGDAADAATAATPIAPSVTNVTNEAAATEQPTTPAAPVAPEPGPPPGAEFVPPSTWGWTGPRVEDSGPPPTWPPAPPGRGDDSAPRKGGARTALIGGLAGALVGALVAGGLVSVLDDNDSTPVRSNGSLTSPATSPTQTARQPIVPNDISSLLDAVRPAVVRIDVGDVRSGSAATGTGFIIDSSGVIVTNAHVVAGEDKVTVVLADGQQLAGTVVGEDDVDDLAVVKVDDGANLPTVELGDSDQVRVGDPVVAIGNALGMSEGSGATVTTGIISGLDRIVRVENETLFDAIQTDAAINPGNSGGPLLDMNGRVIGINSAIASPDTSNNVGFAISIDSAKQIIDDLREGKTPQIAFLGVSTETVTPDLASDVGADSGAVVIDVTSGSAAGKAGLQEGDVIVELDGKKITSFEQVASTVRKHQPGDTIKVVVVRDGKQQSLDVTLGKRPND
jgi:putative serine protease PepD